MAWERKQKASLPLISYDTYMNALRGLYPVMDELSKVKTDHPNTAMEQGRWAVWQMALLLRRMAQGQSDTWRQESPDPFRFRDGKFEKLTLMPKVCGRPTKKGTECKRVAKHGRPACYNHMNLQEKLLARQYQDAIHLPFPRVGGPQFEEELKARLNNELTQVLTTTGAQ